VPHRLFLDQHFCELGRINVAQTLLSVLVMLGSIEQINVC
jgi:hypothetical protein